MTGRSAQRKCDRTEIEIEQSAAEGRGVIILRARCCPCDDLNLPPCQPKFEIGIPYLITRASGFGRKIFAGQLSKSRLQYGDEAISVMLWVAITIPALRFRSVRSAP
jgi:hypothetical protein